MARSPFASRRATSAALRQHPDAARFVDESSRFVVVEDLHVHVRRAGRGPRIVLLHGSGASLHAYDGVARRLVDRFEVIRLDLPGAGLTGPRADRDYRVESYVSFLHTFLSEQVAGPYVLAGHSFGGQLAWTYALDHPAQLAGLVLMNATGYPDKTAPRAFSLARNPLLRPLMRRLGSRSATARSLGALVGPASAPVDDAVVDRVHSLMSLPGNRSAFVDLANTDHRDRSADLGRIDVPTLVLRSDLVDGQHFARDIPGSVEQWLPGVGHLMPDEAPDLVADALAGFVTGLDLGEA